MLAINGVSIGLNHPAIFIDDRTEVKFGCRTTSTPTSAMNGTYHQRDHDGVDHVYQGSQDASNSYTVTVATSYTGTYYCIVEVDFVRSDQSYQAVLRGMLVAMYVYRVFPTLPSTAEPWHTLNIYIFMIPHQLQINMQDFRPPT